MRSSLRRLRIWGARGPAPIEFDRDGAPFYVAGLYDDAQSVIRTLEAAVGEGN
ncbi:hypothetical protein [Streptomyces sp. A30]|uniref:hypothetical protein n=1 Tax=Streptomyces sp. A30 TaxID=2789273 RepID=UPI00397FA837